MYQVSYKVGTELTCFNLRLADLCNGKADCPNGDDENYFQCFYHRAVSLFFFPGLFKKTIFTFQRSEEYRRLMKMLEEIKGK